MIRAVETYLAARRAAGFELKTECYLLFSFARFAAARGEMHIRTSTAIDWASRTVSVAQRDSRLKAVCRFARYMCAEDSRHELPPSRHFGYRKTRPLPHIYSREEVLRLMDTALKFGPQATSHCPLLRRAVEHPGHLTDSYARFLNILDEAGEVVELVGAAGDDHRDF